MKHRGTAGGFAKATRLFSWVICAVVVLGGVATAGRADGRNRKILVLHSYHRADWSNELLRGIESVLVPKYATDLFVEYMDTKKNRSPEYLATLRALYEQKYAGTDFDVVIVSDDNAFHFALEHHDDLFRSSPVVFCGVNRFDDAMLAGHSNVTGVVETHDFGQTLAAGFKIVREAKRVFVICDETRTGVIDKEDLLAAVRDSRPEIEYVVTDGYTLEQLESALTTLSDDTLAFFVSFWLDSTGRSVSPGELGALFRASAVPVFSHAGWAIGNGITGGKCVSAFDHGKRAADLAAGILEGAPVANLPVVTDGPGTFVFDFRALERHGIPLSSLPDAAVVINRPSRRLEVPLAALAGLLSVIFVLGSSIVALVYSAAKRRVAEQALRDNEERFRSLVETTSDWIWEVDNDACFTYASPRVHDILGYAPEELLGRSIYSLLSPQEADKLRRRVGPFVDNDLPFSGIPNEVRCKDGSVALMESSAVPFFDENGELAGYRGIDRDITERKRAESALRLTQFAIDHTTSSAFWINESGQFIYVNESACRALSYSEEELLQLSVWDIDPNVKADRWPFLLERLQSEEYHEESCHLRKDGVLVPVEIVGNCVEFEGRAYVCAFARDISQRKQMEERLRQAQKMEAVGQLAGGVAHDFNNMLGGIMGAAELIRMDAGGNPEIESNVDVILRSASRASNLTNKLLAFSRKGKVVREPVNVHDVLSAATEILRYSIDRRISIVMKQNASEPQVLGDSALLQSAVLNLCINGRDAMPSGGRLVIATRNVELTPEVCSDTRFDIEPGPYVQITVSDTGIGMTEAIIGHIFEPFFTTKGVGHGTGLGLSAVYGTVIEHGGMIQVRSIPGEGATFTISLPAWQAARDDSKPDTPQPELQTRKCGILLVEDEDGIRDVVGKLLERMGYRVFRARDGQEGVDVFRAEREHIDVVLVDMMMPRMDGAQCFAEILEVDPDARVIMASGFSHEEDVNALLEKGLKGFVHKPYHHKELANAISKAMGED